ncbi:ABC transporter permease DevC [Candidatus Synechococcus spongiarum]|uniref:DevC-like ABC transporter permease component n=1 Tax=Candidatus Synechococcus spongiarum TaxID=431041 RepID=A0A164ZRW8_9SYNE|nr:ABC transporter permease DevC [Candidatus Synechococcus spongiarum]SAY39096.1 DevC-like ABC transporter permease component [Candidatus Synechococcus spongiarum]
MRFVWRRRIPLAWCLLTRQPGRLVVALAGICFAGMLMFLQLGFRDALFDASITIYRLFNADVVVVSSTSSSSVSMEPFPQRRLFQAASWPEVESIAPVRWSLLVWKNPETGSPRAIQAVGFDPNDDILNLKSLTEQKKGLQLDQRVLYDRLSRPEFGPVEDWFNAGRTVTAEVQNTQVWVEGLVELGVSFGADGHLLTSNHTFNQLVGSSDGSSTSIELGLIRLVPGADPDAVAAALNKALPDDVQVLTKQEFLDSEQDYWREATSIGFIFNLGAAMGLVVGAVVVYQILFSDVVDHLPEYATLKAMGYSSMDLVMVILQESLLLAGFGYIPAFLAGKGIYGLARGATNLPIVMSSQMAIFVFVMIFVMCIISGLLAMGKIRDADPAEVF